MADVDWPTLLLLFSTALVTGGVAFGSARAGARAFESATVRELDKMREDYRNLSLELRDLRKSLENCVMRHSHRSEPGT